MKIVKLSSNEYREEMCLPDWCPPTGECMPDDVCAPDEWCPPTGECHPDCSPSYCDDED